MKTDDRILAAVLPMSLCNWKFTLAFQQLRVIKRVRGMKNYIPFHNRFHALSVCSIVIFQMVPFDPNLQLFQPQNQYLLPHMGHAWQLQHPDAKPWNVFLWQHHLGLWPAFFIVSWMFTLIALLGCGTTCGTHGRLGSLWDPLVVLVRILLEMTWLLSTFFSLLLHLYTSHTSVVSKEIKEVTIETIGEKAAFTAIH